jgi:hypothetical protein
MKEDLSTQPFRRSSHNLKPDVCILAFDGHVPPPPPPPLEREIARKASAGCSCQLSFSTYFCRLGHASVFDFSLLCYKHN